MLLVDVALACGFAATAVAIWLAAPFTLWACLVAAGLAALALFVAVASLRPVTWICAVPKASPLARGTALRYPRATGERLPCPYPSAHYVLALSHEVPPGGVKEGNACGKLFVVWRPLAPGAEAVVMDAHCPHLGASLAGGSVDAASDCIRCPFHGWTFDKEGKVDCVPGADSCPPNGNLRRYPSVEQNGVISVWLDSVTDHHRRAPGPSETQPAPAPPPIHYAVPRIRELNGDGAAAWVYHGVSEHIVNALLWEIPENGSDVAHLPALHSGFIIPSLSPTLGHVWSATWEAVSEATGLEVSHGTLKKAGAATMAHPYAHIRITEAVSVFNVSLPGEVHVSILQAGPTQVYLRMRTPVGDAMVVETVTPVAPMKLRVLHAVYAQPTMPRLFALGILTGTVRQFERDIPIWEAKQYVRTPVLSKADKAIPAYRRWTSQFFSEASVTFQEAARAQAAREMGLSADARLDW